MVAKRHTWRWFRYSVRCQECNWELLDTKNGLGLAAQHCDRYGHDVHVEVSGGVTYTQRDAKPYISHFPGDKL